MKLSKIASQVIKENDVKLDSLSQEFEVSEPTLESLKDAVDKLNVKAAKWKVPPLKIDVVSERTENTTEKSPWGDDEVVGITKFLTIKIVGDVPRVDGFEFVGKIEHTPTGENILNIAPGSPVKNLPELYRNIKGKCDVCQSNRERFNTFVLQLEKESEKFPDKKAGDLIQVGSGCLKRFLPNMSVDSLVNYAKMLSGIRLMKDEEPKDSLRGDKSAPDQYKNHIPTDILLKYVILAYVGTGKFVSKKKVDIASGEISTAEEALKMMFDKDREENNIVKRLKANPHLLDHAKDLEGKVKTWMEATNFNDFSKSNPIFSDYYHNINILSKSPTINTRNVGYFASILSTYLRNNKPSNEKTEDSEKTFVGRIGERINFHGKLLSMKSFPSKFGSNVTLYKFENLDGNRIDWWSSLDPGFIQGEIYSLSGLVKEHKIDGYTKLPTTMVKNVKINKM